MTPTTLLNILIENKLNMNNYKEWKRNLMIALSCEKLKIDLDNKCPPATQVEARKHLEESDEIAHCYMLAKKGKYAKRIRLSSLSHLSSKGKGKYAKGNKAKFTKPP
ncbi:hypothetical protein J1N35_041510 [Gossypium stocksii]|uniref:Uncharacterized protein n=1 Tax=Gossypium stocksii TaxID=47602 RepID=A0A9D3UFM1_9ROSI|nr:hypothetical protein J1N35_041510 [Gossypium stocksii]